MRECHSRKTLRFEDCRKFVHINIAPTFRDSYTGKSQTFAKPCQDLLQIFKGSIRDYTLATVRNFV